MQLRLRHLSLKVKKILSRDSCFFIVEVITIFEALLFLGSNTIPSHCYKEVTLVMNSKILHGSNCEWFVEAKILMMAVGQYEKKEEAEVV